MAEEKNAVWLFCWHIFKENTLCEYQRIVFCQHFKSYMDKRDMDKKTEFFCHKSSSKNAVRKTSQRFLVTFLKIKIQC